jgi:hypothetical protein
LVWNTTDAQSGGNLTGTSSTNPLSVSSSETVYAQVQSCPGYANSTINNAIYTIGSPIALVLSQSFVVSGSGNTGTSLATGCTGSSSCNTTGADFILVTSLNFGSGGCTAGNLTDNKSNSYTLIGPYNNSGSRYLCMWYATNPTVGTGHTWTQANSYYTATIVSAWSSVITSSPLDVHTGSSSSSSTTTISTGSVTPSVNNDLCVASGTGYFGGSDTSWSEASPAANFTTVQYVASAGGSNAGGILGYQVQTTATATSTTVTPAAGGATDTLTGMIACFKHQ